MADYKLISADSHFVEPPNMWAERIDKQYRDRAPRIVHGVNGQDADFFVCENVSPTPVAGFFAAGIKPETLPEHIKRGFAGAPPSVWDPAARVKDQDLDGVQAEMIYTSMGMPLYGLDDANLRAACFRAYNDWAVEYCSPYPKRLLPLGLLTLEDIDAGIKELTRIVNKGMKGAMIWAEAPDERPYNHRDYDPFWAAAQDLNVPLSLHILTGRRGTGIDFMKGNIALQASTIHHQIERTLALFVFGGVFERFPKLRIVSAENDVAWMPYLLWRMDLVQKGLGVLDSTKLSLLPSEYIKRQVWATFIKDPIFINSLDRFGADNIMWSSDYPHRAATWPRSREFVSDTFGSLDEVTRRKIVHDTAARVYGLD